MRTYIFSAFLCCCVACEIAVAANGTEELPRLGQALFFDTNLSARGNQSCASCHDPGRAFSDGRDNGVAGAVSLGDDGRSLGQRNTPATTYAYLVPEFGRDENNDFFGGFFLDGRAATLAEQAAEPFTNPLEMAMPDRAAVIGRIREKPNYVGAFEELFGKSILSDPEAAFVAVTKSIAAFEQTRLFATFDSKYDRYLRGEYAFTAQEELGRVLFFSQLINCSSCHLGDSRESSPGELFTNHRYHNIGVPPNGHLAAIRNEGGEYRDTGLLGNPRVHDPAMTGKFRVPSLRNVAVTGPYMHNGVFRELRTAILFYNRFTLSNPQSQFNPETGKPWGDPEIAQTVDLELLRSGQPLADNHVDALVAFLRTLTDQRYEALLPAGSDLHKPLK